MIMWYFGKIINTEEWGFDCFKTSFENYIEITEEEHDSLVGQAQAQGKWISGDEEGHPILIDPPAPTPEEIKAQKLQELHSYLKSTDWYAIRYADTGVPIPAEIKQKRQETREEISELESE